MDKVKVIQIGVEGFGKYISDIIKRCSNIELVGVYDINRHFALRASEALNVMPFSSLKDALAYECDGVVMVVPNNVHAELVKSVAIARKHIFLEKPIANSIEDAQEIINICKEQGVMLQIGHNMRFMEKYRRTKELIESNAIGQVVMIEGNYSTERAKRHNKSDWRYSRNTCPGGPMLQLGIHLIDTICFLTGCRPLIIKGVFADEFTETQNEDAGAIVMKMENGLLAYIGSSYVSPLTETLVIYGNEGRIDIRNNTVLMYRNQQEEVVEARMESEDACYIRQLESFAGCILQHRRPAVDGETGLHNLEVVLSALKAGGI